MAYKTFGELKLQVEKEVDIEEEEFIQSDELRGFFNSAVAIVQAEIVKLGLREKYLETEAFIDVVQGQKDYDIPLDMVDTKIRKVVYRDGTTIYELKPFVGEDSYEAEDILNLYNSSEYYHYRIFRDGENWKFRIIPKGFKSVTAALRISYFRNLNVYDDDNTNCDVPQICYEFILSYVRYRVFRKESHVNTASEKEDMNNFVDLMRETLQGQIADPNLDRIDQDVTAYEEMS